MMLQSRPGRFRFSVILTATAKGIERYDNFDAMPPVLRARCVRALESRTSGTVLIAGQAEQRPAAKAGDRAIVAPSPAPPARASRRGSAAAWLAAALQILVAALALAAWWLASRG